ncbi:MAG: hypothetical protein A3J28_02245 [Acidobacteria bacterium RIFCSPLOWO2_12_FULL_60_22]|nr:MAG: hypothetical protein A3J28_02245 [Acidobacteria bacterium RIFCSPLOWO2_12_FULL_60_22]
MNLYEQQESNRRRTWLIMAIFIVFLAFLGFGFDYYYLGYDPWLPPHDRSFPSPFPFPLATVASFCLACYWSAWGLYGGDQAVLSSASAVRVYPGTPDPKKQQLLNVVEEMSIAGGMPLPQVYLIADTDPNAFATGRDPQHASVTVTQGLLDKLNREELQGVIGHEMSHVRNLDIRLMTVVAALVGAVVLLSDWALRAMRSGAGRGSSRGSRKGGAGALVLILWLLTLLLAPILARLLAMAVSREREYLADASGAELTRNPAALASALKKIEMDVAPTVSIKSGTAHLCIADPMGRKIGLREGFWADLFGTHPPMHLRISKLMQMAYQASPAGPQSEPRA